MIRRDGRLNQCHSGQAITREDNTRFGIACLCKFHAKTLAEDLTVDEMAGALIIQQRKLENLSNKIPWLNPSLPKNQSRLEEGRFSGKSKIMNDYQLFWIEFDKISEKTGGLLLSGKSREAFEIIDDLLTILQIDFCFDLSVLGNRPSLIFSPEGDPATAKKIDALVARKNSVDEWVILSRRPAKGIQDVRAIIQNLYLVDPELCRYEISPVSRNRVIIFIPLDSDLTDSECTGFANTLLWHTLGETEVMNRNLKHEVNFGIPGKMDLLRLEEMRNRLLRADHSD